MGSGTLWRPVGPRPPRVYWTRRLVLLAAAVIVVVVLAHACSGGTTHPRATAPPTGSSPSPSPSLTQAATGTTDCRKPDLQVTAATDAPSYPSGALPRLSAVVRNVSNRTCRFRTSAGQRIWTIVSGQDQVWSSADCTISGVKAKSKLKAGHTIAYALVWNRHRSAKGCPAQTPAAAPGTYQLRVSVNGVDSATVVFHLTG
jgi:hypothetical protein